MEQDALALLFGRDMTCLFENVQAPVGGRKRYPENFRDIGDVHRPVFNVAEADGHVAEHFWGIEIQFLGGLVYDMVEFNQSSDGDGASGGSG